MSNVCGVLAVSGANVGLILGYLDDGKIGLGRPVDGREGRLLQCEHCVGDEAREQLEG